MKSSFLLAAAFAILLAGCAAPAPAPAPVAAAPAPVAPPPPPQPQCSADGAKFAIGQQASPQLEAAARARASAAVSRVLRPGQAVTMEFNASRINLDVDARGRVTGARCG